MSEVKVTNVYKYIIEVTYIPKDGSDEDTITIESKNIRSCIIDYNYSSEAIQPIISMILWVDKNLIDKITKGQDTDTITLSISKKDIKSQTQLELSYININCSYKVANDINQTKEKDYMGSNSDISDKDNYAELRLGMFSKDLVEQNVKSINFVATKSKMISLIANAVQGIPIVIEPLTYNKEIDQLIIKPQESIKQTLKYLNDIAVFYDTPYRFFMDFDKSYLLSSSGKKVEAKGEKYSSIKIDIRGVTEGDSFQLGQEDSSNDNCYIIPVTSIDATYSIDNTTAKKYNNIVGIMNPNRKNSLPNIKTSLMTKVTSILDGVNNIADSASNIAKNMVNQMNSLAAQVKTATNKYTEQFTQFTDYKSLIQSEMKSLEAEVNSAIAKANSAASSSTTGTTPTYYPVLNINSESYISKMDNQMNICSSSNQKITGGSTDFLSYKDDMQSGSYDAVSITSYTNGVKTENLVDNFSGMTTLCSENTASQTSNLQNITSISSSVSTNHSTIQSASDTYHNTVTDFMNQLKSAAPNTTITDSAGNSVTIKVDFSKLEGLLGESQSYVNKALGYASVINDACTNGIDFSKQMQNVTNNITSKITNLTSLKDNITSMVQNTANTWLQQTNDLISQVKSVSTMASLGISSIADLSDISKIADLSGASKLGIEVISTKIDIPKNTEESTKNIFVTINNDDPNKIKNIQYATEMNAVQLKIMKQNIDNSILTLNKEYTVSTTVQDRKNQDGKYILRRKIEMYILDQDEFDSTVMLNLTRVPNSKNTTNNNSSSSSSTSTTNNTSSSYSNGSNSSSSNNSSSTTSNSSSTNKSSTTSNGVINNNTNTKYNGNFTGSATKTVSNSTKDNEEVPIGNNGKIISEEDIREKRDEGYSKEDAINILMNSPKYKKVEGIFIPYTSETNIDYDIPETMLVTDDDSEDIIEEKKLQQLEYIQKIADDRAIEDIKENEEEVENTIEVTNEISYETTDSIVDIVTNNSEQNKVKKMNTVINVNPLKTDDYFDNEIYSVTRSFIPYTTTMSNEYCLDESILIDETNDSKATKKEKALAQVDRIYELEVTQSLNVQFAVKWNKSDTSYIGYYPYYKNEYNPFGFTDNLLLDTEEDESISKAKIKEQLIFIKNTISE